MSGERGMQVKSDAVQRSWENAEFPILCEGCLGNNPYVRMIVDKFNGSCKMCERPFNVFKWKPGRGEGYRKTEVCQSCARVKNLCQTCILDLQLGLPSQLRDAVLAGADDEVAVPESAINREYVTQQQLMLLETEGADTLGEIANEKLLKIARTVSTNRSQTRVKMFQQAKPVAPADVGNAEDRKRSRVEMEDTTEEASSSAMALPPGVESFEQLAQSMNLSRLPPAMQSFLKKQYGVADNDASESNADSSKSTAEGGKGAEKAKKQKIKFFPKPPAGPPPPEALAAAAVEK